jgi:hypothetical protein
MQRSKGEAMQKIYLVAAAAGLLLAFGSVAEAKGPGPGPGAVGGGGSPPSGFSEGNKTGFDGGGQPRGWDQGLEGKGDTWKTDATDPTKVLPPGLSDPKH